MRPSVGASSPIRMLKNVDFPQPVLPTMATTSPRSTSKSSRSIATTASPEPFWRNTFRSARTRMPSLFWLGSPTAAIRVPLFPTGSLGFIWLGSPTAAIRVPLFPTGSLGLIWLGSPSAAPRTSLFAPDQEPSLHGRHRDVGRHEDQHEHHGPREDVRHGERLVRLHERVADARGGADQLGHRD